MAKRKFSKVISLVCALSLVLSIMVPLSMVSWAETDVSTTFTQQSIDVDFSQFDANLLTRADGPFKAYYTDKGAFGGTCFSYADGVLTYTRSANEPKFYNVSGDGNKNFLSAYETFPVSVTGGTGNAANIYKLTLNQLYRVKVTYKVDTLTEGEKVTLKAAYTPKSGKADNVGAFTSTRAVNLYTDPNLTNAKVVSATTDGYITEELYFMFKGDAFKYDTNTINEAYLWLWMDANIGSSSIDFSMSFDSVRADAVSKVTFNAIDANTNEVTSIGLTYVGAPEETLSFAEAENKINNLSNSTVEILWYRDKDINDQVLDTSSEVYTTTKEVAYYAWVKTTGGFTNDITVDFEDYQLRKYTGVYSGDSASFNAIGFNTARFNIISSPDSHSGDKVMSFKVQNYTYVQQQMYLYLGDGKADDGLDIEDKSIYKMTFYLKKDPSVAATGDLKITFGNGGGLWSFVAYDSSLGVNNIADRQLIISPADLPEDWTQYTVYAYIDCDNRNNCTVVTNNTYLLAPSIAVNTDNGKSVAVFMDDFIISKVAGGKNADSIIVEHIGNEKQYVSGTSGEAVTIPPLSDTDTQTFEGWYTDSGYTTKYTATAFATGITHIYAKYTNKTPTQPDDGGNGGGTTDSSVICDFESYTQQVTSNNVIFRYDRFSISADAAYGNSGNGLKYHFIPTTTEGKNGTELEPDTGYNKGISSSVKLLAGGKDITVKDNTWYKMKFKYQVISSDSDINVYPITSQKSNVWYNDGKTAAREYTKYAVTIASNKEGNGWHEGEIIFQTSLTKESNNCLYLWVGLKKKTEAQVYFDDITVTETTAPVSDGSVKVEFDNYSSIITNNKLTFRNTVFKIDKSQSYGGLSSLRFFFDPNNETIKADTTYNKMSNSAVLVDADGKTVKVENETVYEVTFYYNATDINSDMQVCVLTSDYVNMWRTDTNSNGKTYGLYNWYRSNSYTIPQSHNGEGWKQAKLYFKTDIISDSKGNPADTLFLWVGCGSNIANELYIDSVSVKKLDPTDGVVTFISNDTIGTTYQFGNVGDVINFPNLDSYTQFTFCGWYTDAEHTQEYTGTTIPSGITNIYAKVIGPIGTSFEDYPVSWTTNKTIFRYDRFFLSKQDAYEGDTSIKFAYDPNNRMEDTSFNKETACSFLINNGSGTIKLTQNAYYKITFWYKAVSGESIKVIPYAGQNGNIWNGKSTKFKSYYEIGKEEQGKGWQQATMYIYADMKDANNNSLYLWMAPNTDKAAVCYIDNVEVTELYTDSGMGIYLDYQQISLSPVYIFGNIGDAIKLPTPKVKGLDFTGWYVDAACTKPFTSTVFNKVGIHTIYAGWKIGKETYVDFEGTNINVTPNRSQIRYVNGSKVWEIDKTVDYVKDFAGIMLTPGDKFIQVKKDQVFLIEFSYYVAAVPSDYTNDYFGEFYVQTSDKANVWGNYKDASTHLSFRTQKGKWITEKFFVKANPSSETSNYLSMFMKGLNEGFKLYIDNIKIVSVYDNEALVKFTTNLPGDNEYKDAVIVPKGTVVNFPTLTLENYGFIGKWFTNASYRTPYKGSTYKADESKEFFSYFYCKRYVQDFENENINALYDPLLCVYADTDHEISSADKHSGKYSMHRIGEYNDYQSFILFPGKSTMADGITYTISYWIKVESSDHKLGAIRLTDSRVQTWGWGRVGEIHYTVPFKDICDGQWHQVSYSFKAAGPRYALYTPGYASVYIDDIVVEATLDAQLSTKPEFEEYVPYRKEAIVQPTEEIFEIPEGLFVESGGILGGISVWIIVVIAAAVVLIIGGVTTTIIITKKKNQNKGGVK